MLILLVTWLCYVNTYTHYVFPAALLTTPGKRIRIIILLYCVILTYDMITSLGMRLGWYLYAALLSCVYLRRRISEFINNRTQSMGKTGGGG